MPLRAWLKFRRPTIEPVIFLYAYGLFMHLPVIQQYIYKRVSDAKGFPYSASSKESCSNQTLNATLKGLEKEVNVFIVTVICLVFMLMIKIFCFYLIINLIIIVLGWKFFLTIPLSHPQSLPHFSMFFDVKHN